MRLLPLFLLALLLVPDVLAQRSIAFGARAGGGTATLQSTLTGIDSRPGFQAAVFASLPLSPEFSVLAELEYGLRGYRGRQEERSEDDRFVGIVSAMSTLHLLSVPVLARIQPREPILGVVPYGLFGPRIDVVVGREGGTFRFSNGTEMRDAFVDGLESVSMGATVGGGAAVAAIAGFPIRVEARQSFGLTDMLPQRSAAQVNLRTFEINLAVSF